MCPEIVSWDDLRISFFYWFNLQSSHTL
jgi:hypothetical protein